MRLDKFLLKCADKGYKPELVGGWGSKTLYSQCHSILYEVNGHQIKFHKQLDGTDELVAFLTNPNTEKTFKELGI